MSKRLLTNALATSMALLIANGVSYKAHKENTELLSDAGSAMYLPKRSYKNKLRKNKVKK